MSINLSNKIFKSILLNSRIRTADVSRLEVIGRLPKVKTQDFYICSFSSLLLNSNQFEACRKVVTRIVRRQKPKPTFFPCLKFNLPYTSKSKNSRMGKGKGGVAGFVSRVNVFGPLFLLRESSFVCASKIMDEMENKLPTKLCLLAVRQRIQLRQNTKKSSTKCFNIKSSYKPFKFKKQKQRATIYNRVIKRNYML